MEKASKTVCQRGSPRQRSYLKESDLLRPLRYCLQNGRPSERDLDVSGHIVLCGAADSFLPFVTELRRVAEVPVTLVYSSRDFDDYNELMATKNVFFVEGSPTDKAFLDKAGIPQSM